MKTNVAIMSIILKDGEQAETVNALLHLYAGRIIGRMGIPYREKGIHIISIALDAPEAEIGELAGRIEALPGVRVKTVLAGE